MVCINWMCKRVPRSDQLQFLLESMLVLYPCCCYLLDKILDSFGVARDEDQQD